MNSNTNILDFFNHPQSIGDYSNLNLVIEICYKIALKYLHSNQLRINKILLSEEITTQELAIDCISELFIKDNTSDELVIRTAFYNWRPAIKTEDDCFYFLNKVVANRVEQHLVRLLKSADPFFSKILDSINYLVKQNGLAKIQFLGKTFIIKAFELDVQRNFINTERFEQLPSNIFLDKKKLFANLFEYIKDELYLSEAIPLNDLVKRLKSINFLDFILTNNSVAGLNEIETSEIVELAIKETQSKLNSSYLEKGKLNQVEKTAFELALNDMANDLLDGGIQPGLYNYLKPYITGLNENDYKENYHNILEYLLKVMKNKITEQLKLEE